MVLSTTYYLGAHPPSRSFKDWLEVPWIALAGKMLFNIPIASMYGIFTYIWLFLMVKQPNVGKYAIHGWYGITKYQDFDSF